MVQLHGKPFMPELKILLKILNNITLNNRTTETNDIIDGLFYYFSHGINDFSKESVETISRLMLIS